MKVCGIYNIKDIDETILNIQNKIHEFSYSRIVDLINRYTLNRGNITLIIKKIDKLFTYKDILVRLKERVLAGCDPCMDRKQVQQLMEKITDILGKNCKNRYCNIIIGESREEEWVIKKPYCRTYQEWEKWSKYICEQLDLELKFEIVKRPDFILDIVTQTIKPEVLLALSVYTEVRDKLNLEINRSEEQTKLDFELLVEKIPNIDLDLKVYAELVNKYKLSFDIIKTIYENGLNLQITTKGVEMKTPINIYNISQLSGTINMDYLKKFGIKTDIDKNNFLQDYK